MLTNEFIYSIVCVNPFNAVSRYKAFSVQNRSLNEQCPYVIP